MKRYPVLIPVCLFMLTCQIPFFVVFLVSSTSGVKNILQTNQMQQHLHEWWYRSLMDKDGKYKLFLFFFGGGGGLFLKCQQTRNERERDEESCSKEILKD